MFHSLVHIITSTFSSFSPVKTTHPSNKSGKSTSSAFSCRNLSLRLRRSMFHRLGRRPSEVAIVDETATSPGSALDSYQPPDQTSPEVSPTNPPTASDQSPVLPISAVHLARRHEFGSVDRPNWTPEAGSDSAVVLVHRPVHIASLVPKFPTKFPGSTTISDS